MYSIIVSYMLFSSSLQLNEPPKCMSCKWFKMPPSKSPIDEYGLCKLFKNNYDINGNKFVVYEYAKHCRKNENMCGEEGYLYESDKDKNFLNEIDKQEEFLEYILDEYDELNNRGWGEVNENSEIEEIEEDFINLFIKVKQFLKKQ